MTDKKRRFGFEIEINKKEDNRTIKMFITPPNNCGLMPIYDDVIRIVNKYILVANWIKITKVFE